MEELITRKKTEIKKFMLVLCLFDIAITACCFHQNLRSYNSTMLALTYRNGFTSRSLLGTIYHIVNNITPWNMIDYTAAVRFAEILTALFLITLLYFSYRCISATKYENMRTVEFLLLFISLTVVATFTTAYNFFRVDIFMVCVSLFAVLILINEKAEWLVILLAAVGVMFHQGYVLMYANVILIALFYKMLSDKTKWKKYLVYLLVTFGLISALFIWFELLSRTDGSSFFDTVRAEAEALSYNGIYHTTLLYHEVLGIDLSETERNLAHCNYQELPFLIIFCLPYIVMLVKFFGGLIKDSKEFLDKFKYLGVAVGSLTLLPDFLLKVDWGRWMMALCFYYMVIIIFMCVMEDEPVLKRLDAFSLKFKTSPWYFLLLILPVFMVPFMDVNVNNLHKYLSKIIYQYFFGKFNIW